MKTFLRNLLSICLLVTLCSLTHAATRTAGATGSDFTTIDDAVTSHTAGGWGDGDDTILVRNETFVVTGQLLATPQGGGSLTIKGETLFTDPALNPVLAFPATSLTAVFRLSKPGTVTLEGLTIIGPDGVATQNANAAIRIDTTVSPAGPLDVVVKNCVITANAGGNVPKTDWGSDNALPTNGRIGYAIQHTSTAGVSNLYLSNSTIAYTATHATDKSGLDSVTSSVGWHISHVLFTRLPDRAVRFRDGLNPSEVDISESAVIRGAIGVTFGRNSSSIPVSGITAHLTVEDFIFDAVSGSAFAIDNISSTEISVKRATFLRPTGASDQFIVTAPGPGVTIRMHDCITHVEDSMLRILPEATHTTVTLDLANLATVNMANPTRAADRQYVKDAFAALYGGTGPIKTDPLWVSGFGSGYEVLDGVIGWDRSTNTLYDVGSMDYFYKGSSGGFRPYNFLAGGGDVSMSVPVELSTFDVD